MDREDETPDKPEDIQESAWALFEKSARLRREANQMALRAHELLEKARKLKEKREKKDKDKKGKHGH